jgi:serine/threonine protein kinase
MHVEEGILLSHFRVLERIGEGGMSEVWRALDTRLERVVAIKLLPEAFEADAGRRARLETEAKAIASLNHPNIVTVHSIEDVDGCLILAMELVGKR